MTQTKSFKPAFLQTSIKEGICLLSWAAAHDSNNSYYDIQRSTDGLTFMDLGRIYATMATTTTICYHFRDLQPSIGINNYRLKLVDRDGKVVYSDIVSLWVSDHAINA